MWRFSFRSLRARLILLVLLAILPALGLVLFTAVQQRYGAAADAQADALRLARVAAQDEQLLIQGASQLLLAVSKLPEVLAADPSACDVRFAALLQAFPRYSNIGALRTNGDLYCSAVPVSTPINASDRTYFREAIAIGGFSIGDYQIGRDTGKPGLYFGYPVTDEAGVVQAVVFVALDLDWVSQLAAVVDLPEGAALTVFDRTGIVLAEYPEPETWVGRTVADADVVEAILSRGESGTLEAVGLDGVQRLYGFTSLHAAPGTDDVFVTVGIPSSIAFAKVDQILRLNLLGLATVAILTIAAVWFGGDLLVLRRVDALIDAAKRLGSGEMHARAGVAEESSELADLARAFDDMAERLAEREATLKATVEELRKVNRQYRMLSSCNQTLIRSASEPDLLEEICRTIVATGGYRMAWVGLAEKDEGQTVRPVAQAGFADGSLESIRVSLADNELGRGPAGTAIRSGKPFVARDILRDEELAPWRAEAVRMGYASSIALPLSAGSQALGALCLSAAEPDAFGEEEVGTLVELANDLSYGVMALRSNAGRQQAQEEVRRRAAQQEAVNKIIGAALGATDLRQFLEAVMDHTLPAMGLTVGAVWIGKDVEARGMPIKLCRRIAEAVGRAGEDTPEVSLVGGQAEERGDAEASALTALMADHGLRAWLMVPVRVKGERLGGLCLGADVPRAWTDQEIALVQVIGGQLGGAAERLNLIEVTRVQARQLQRVLDTVQEGILALDPHATVMLANPRGQEYLALLAGLGVGDKLTRLGDMTLADVIEASREGIPADIVFGSTPERVFEVSPSSGAAGGMQRETTLLIREVTEVRHFQKRAQLQDRLAAVGQLAAGIAHDFNNIIGTIILYSELLRRESGLSTQGMGRLDTIHMQARRAAGLTQQILDFSRRSVVTRHPMDLVPFLKGFQKLMGRTLPENIQLKLLYEEQEYVVSADPGRMQQVFMNLALNARDAMPNGGSLEVEMSRLMVEPGERPPFQDMPAGEWVRVRVSDTGTGTPADVLPHIFEPFFTTKVPGEGSGLGLSQVYGIVKQHDGYIDVESHLGKGTTFTIYLPAVSARPLPNGIPVIHTSIEGQGESILVVEDDAAALQAMRDTLEALNYEVLVALDGSHALGRIEEAKDSIALVVSDMVMPKTGGMALYKMVRERYPWIKVLLVTGYPLGDKTGQLLEEGKAAWLQKPFDSETLGAKIACLLKRG
jgi:signal transduction histidine kinase